MDKKVRTDRELEEELPDAGTYYVLEALSDSWYVTSFVAEGIGRQLDSWWWRLFHPWLKFMTLTGERVWVRVRIVESITESTPESRARCREMGYRQRKEEKADRRWDDDEE